MPWKKAKKRGMMAIPLEIDRYFNMSFTFMPVMRSVKGESLDEPWEAFFKAASLTSPARSRSPEVIIPTAKKCETKL